MNRALPEMLHGLNSPANVTGGTEMSVLESQKAQMKWQLQQQKEFLGFSLPAAQEPQFQGFIGNQMGPDLCVVKPDPGMEDGWADTQKFTGDDYLGFGTYGYGDVPGFELSCAISKSSNCLPPAAAEDTGGRRLVLPEKSSSTVERESFKKRKADKIQSLKVIEEDSKHKRIKEWAEEGDSKITEQNSHKNNNDKNRETSTNTSKENSKITDVQKPDYIHVRARRGQATDSHSLAERVRREKISERMTYLQDLVPGCDKITGKAGMLDEIINYVQSLQKQVEFLSMKLATVNPTLDFDIDNFFPKEMVLASTANFPDNSLSSDMINPAYPLNQLRQLVSSVGVEMGINPLLDVPRGNITAPSSIHDTFLDSFCFNQIQLPLTYGPELQNFYGAEFQQGRTISYPLQPFTGSMAGGNLKMEM